MGQSSSPPSPSKKETTAVVSRGGGRIRRRAKPTVEMSLARGADGGGGGGRGRLRAAQKDDLANFDSFSLSFFSSFSTVATLAKKMIV